MAKRYEELTFVDDFMFGKVMEDKELCREVLECLLEHPVGILEEVQTEREFWYFTDKNRFDWMYIPKTGKIFMMRKCRI